MYIHKCPKGEYSLSDLNRTAVNDGRTYEVIFRGRFAPKNPPTCQSLFQRSERRSSARRRLQPPRTHTQSGSPTDPSDTYIHGVQEKMCCLQYILPKLSGPCDQHFMDQLQEMCTVVGWRPIQPIIARVQGEGRGIFVDILFKKSILLE